MKFSKSSIRGTALSFAAAAFVILGSVCYTEKGANAASSITITSPGAGTTVSGGIRLAVALDGLPTLAAVEYQLDGRPIPSGRVSVAPYALDWNTAWTWNGNVKVEAVGLDSAGQEIARSAALPITIGNGPARMRLVSPSEQTTLSGSVRWSVEVQGGTVEGVVFAVDGRTVNTLYVNPSPSIQLDTTRFSNGWHELFAGAHSLQNPLAMSSVRINFNNGRAIQELLSRWRDVFLLPNETLALEPRWRYTNGDEERAVSGVTYSSSNSSIATVSSSGEVRAVAPGVATITLAGGNRVSTTRVVVNQTRIFPHFSKQGRVLTQYDATQSTLVRTLFHLDVNEAKYTPELPQRMKAAAVNTITTGFYPTLSDMGFPVDVAGFRKSWDPLWTSFESYAQQNDFNLMLIGDNIARGPEALWGALYQPWSTQALQYAFGKIRDSRRVVSVEMVDESSGVWGITPRPRDGRWLRLSPPIPDDSFERLMATINQVPNRPPVSWPILWLSGLEAARNWMGDPAYSDYTSNYWDSNQWRSMYPHGLSLPQLKDSLDNVVVTRYPLMQRDKPAIQLISVAGPYYTKLGPGEEYTPGQDKLQAAGLPPTSVSAQAMYGIAMGMSGLRAYAYDNFVWKNERRTNPVGTMDRQTGADPFRFGTDRWQAMSSSFQLIGELEAHFLQPQIHAVELGADFVTGARQGPQGRVLIALNLSEATSTRSVDLSPYVWQGAGSMKRYRLRGGTLSSEAVAASNTDTVTFSPGEAIVWLFQPSSLSSAAVGVRIQSPLADSAVGGTVTVRADSTGGPATFELLVDGNVLGRSSTPSFSWNSGASTLCTWHSVAIRATNAAGVSTLSTVSLMPVSGSSSNPPPAAPSLTTTLLGPANGLTVDAPGSIPLSASVSAPVSRVEFYNGASLIASVSAAPYTAQWNNVGSGTYSITAKGIATSGSSTSAAATVTVRGVVAPAPSTPADGLAFVKGINLNGPEVRIEGNQWISGASAELEGLRLLNGKTWASSYGFPLDPIADSDTSRMLQSLVYNDYSQNGVGFSLRHPMPNGNYFVYLWMIENYIDNFRSMDARVEGQLVATGIGTLRKGSWRKYGPYAANVLDGELSVDIVRNGSGDPILAGLAIYTAGQAGAAPTIALTAPLNNATYTSPATIPLGATTSGQVSKVEFYSGGSIVGTATAAPYTFNWSGVPAGTYQVSAKAFGPNNTSAASTIASVSVSSPVGVTLTNPLNNSTLTAPATIPLTATTTGSVSKVEFYNGATLLGTTTTAPHTFHWNNIAAGNYLVNAKAYGPNSVASSGSSLVTVSPPTGVTLTSPLSNQTISSPGSVVLAASVSGSTVRQVEFYNGASLLGTATTSPYRYSWTSIPTGTYTVTAKAIPVSGVAVTSAPVSFVVSSALSITLLTPTNGQSMTAPATLNFSASVTGSVSKVEFYSGINPVATVTAAPFAFSWPNVPAGVYSLTAKVTSTSGATLISAPALITVQAPPSAPIVSPPAPDGTTFYSGVNFNGPAVRIDGTDWISQDAAVAAGMRLTDAKTWSSAYTFPLIPTATTATKQMLETVIYSEGDSTGGFSVAYPVPNGKYNVYLWMVENYRDYYRSANVRIENQLVGTALGSFPLGGWAKVGPFNADVADGMLHVAVSRNNIGDPLIAGMAIYRAASQPSVNVSPTVSLTSPSTIGAYTAPATLQLTATAADADGSIQKVEFFSGSILLGTSTAQPYRLQWPNVAAGTYSITAKATDNQGTSTISTPVVLTITAPTVAPPTTPGTTFVTGVNVGGTSTVVEGNRFAAGDAFSDSSVIRLTGGALWASTYAFPLSPVPETGTATMLKSVAYLTDFQRGAFTIQQPVSNGNYWVYFWMLENYQDNYRSAAVKLEQQLVGRQFGILKKGEWRKYGPFPVTVSDGSFSLDVLSDGRAEPLLAGYALFR